MNDGVSPDVVSGAVSGARAPDALGHVPQTVPNADRPYHSYTDADTSRISLGAIGETDDERRWRIESKGNGRFCLRSGSHHNRVTLADYYLYYDDLTNERREQYDHNARRDAAAKSRAKIKWG